MFDYNNTFYDSQDNFDDREKEAVSFRTSWESEGFDKNELDYMSHIWEQD